MASESARIVKRAHRRYGENGREQPCNDENYDKNNEKQMPIQINSTHETRVIYSRPIDCSTTFFNSSEESLHKNKSPSPDKGTKSPATPEVNPILKVVSKEGEPSKSTVTKKRPSTSSGSPQNKRRKTERSSRTGKGTSKCNHNRPRTKTTKKRSAIRPTKQSRRAVRNRSKGHICGCNSNRPRTRSIKRPVSNSKPLTNKNRKVVRSRGVGIMCRCNNSRRQTKTPKRPVTRSKNDPKKNKRIVRSRRAVRTSSVICRCNNKREPRTSSRVVNKRCIRKINRNRPDQNKSTLKFIVQEVVKHIRKSWRNAPSTRALEGERKRRTRKKNSRMKTLLAKHRERQRKMLHQGCTSRGILCKQCESVRKFQLTKSICDSIGKVLESESL